MLYATLQADTKATRIAADEARRAGDTATQATLSDRARLLTTVCSDIAKRGKDDGNREATDKDAVTVLRKFLGGMDESLDNLAKFPNEDTPTKVAVLQGEKALLQPYLDAYLAQQPQAASDEEVETAAKASIAALPETERTMKAMGKVMGNVKTQFGDRLDAAKASAIVKRVLGEAAAAAAAQAKAG